MNTKDPKYQQKSKAISSAEPNYFVHFDMRHLTPLRNSDLQWDQVECSYQSGSADHPTCDSYFALLQ